MRLYNATDRHIDLPLVGNTRLSIASQTVSGEFMPNDEFLRLLPSLYDDSELAVIIAGDFERNAVTSFPALMPMVCTSIDEAVARFSITADDTPEQLNEDVKEEVVEETSTEEPKSESPEQPAHEDVAEKGENTEVEAKEVSKPVFIKKKVRK